MCTGSDGIGHLAVTIKRMICQRQIKVFQGIREFWITFADSSDKFVKPKDRRPARRCEALWRSGELRRSGDGKKLDNHAPTDNNTDSW